MDPTARFEACIARGGSPIEEVALCISAHADRSLDIDEELHRLDALGIRCGDAGGAPSLDALSAFLHGECGLTGDHATYYDADNSRIDRVLDRRVGIPITLSVIWMAVGRRVGLEVAGIGMPGHFLVRSRHDDDAFCDPFGAGTCFDRAGAQRLFAARNGPARPFEPGYLDPVADLDIVARMLANLTQIFVQQSDRASLAWVLRLRTLLPGADASIHRQLAGVLGHLGHYWEAADIFERLIELQPARADDHRRTVQRLRAHAN